MSTDRAMTRSELARLLERAHAIDEARVTGGGFDGALAAAPSAGARLPPLAGSSGAEPGATLRTWLGSPIRFRRVVHSDAALDQTGLERLATLLEELGGVRPRDAAIEAARETDDGLRVRIRPERGGTRIEVTSDRRPEAIGAAIGIASLAVVAAILLFDAAGQPGAAGRAGICAASAVGGWLSLRLHLSSAAVRWQVRLDAVSAGAAALVRRAAATSRPHTELGQA